MEKVVLYKVYYFEDEREGKRYYYEDKDSCIVARFLAYKKYDYERITRNKFVVPVLLLQLLHFSKQLSFLCFLLH